MSTRTLRLITTLLSITLFGVGCFGPSPAPSPEPAPSAEEAPAPPPTPPESTPPPPPLSATPLNCRALDINAIASLCGGTGATFDFIAPGICSVRIEGNGGNLVFTSLFEKNVTAGLGLYPGVYTPNPPASYAITGVGERSIIASSPGAAIAQVYVEVGSKELAFAAPSDACPREAAIEVARLVTGWATGQ